MATLGGGLASPPSDLPARFVPGRSWPPQPSCLHCRSGGLAAVQAVVTRAARLAEKGSLATDVLSAAGVVDPSLFETRSEAGMLEVLNRLEPIATASGSDRYARLAEGLSAGSEALAAFFDGDQSVMVMADDPALRTNRLNLLAVLRNQAAVLAQFELIQS